MAGGYWINRGGGLGYREEARLRPLNLSTCVWTIKQWFSNGSTIMLAIRVNPGDVAAVDEWASREECLAYLMRLMKCPPFYEAAIEGERDRVLRKIDGSGVESSYWLCTIPETEAPAPKEPGELIITPLRNGQDS